MHKLHPVQDAFLLLLPRLCHISLHTRLHKNVRFAKNWKSSACCVCVQLWRPEHPKLKWRMTTGPEGVGLMLRFAWRGWVVWEGADMHFKCNSLTVEGFSEAVPCLLWSMREFFPFLPRRGTSERKIPSQIAVFQHVSMQGSHRQLQSRSCVHN